MFTQQKDGRFLIVLDRDQAVIETLTKLASQHGILGGTITGIGALKDPELGFYELHKRDYIRKTFRNEDFELLALNGNISWRDGAPYIHVHTALGRADFSVIGGHLFEARVAVTAEIYVTTFGIMPERKLQSDLGLQTIVGCRL